MPRILILHASVGTGHKSAASALADALKRNPNNEVRVEDALAYATTLFHEAYTKTYLQVTDKAPLLWKLFYESIDISDIDTAMLGNRLRGLVERPLVSKLEKMVLSFDPDALICTHPLPIEVLQQLKLAGKLRAPIYCVITDFIANSVWINSAVDCYFLASESTRQELITRGVPASALYVSGIPVKPEIADAKDSIEMRKRHNLPHDRSLVVLFGGGIDPERVRLMIEGLLASKTEGTLLIIAGRSESLMKELADVEDSPHMQVLKYGFIPHVDDIVAASDLVITKSGGLIVSEVLARGTPMIIIDPIPGQEEWNADFVAGSGAGIQLRMPESVPLAALNLLEHTELLASMRQQAQRAGRPRAALDIAEYVLEDLRTGRHS